MITIQKIGKLFILFLIVAGLASCNNDDETAPFDVIGEAIIVKRKINDETKYARMFYAYGNYAMTSAEVSLPEGGELALEPTDSNKRTYYSIPDTSDFSTTLPATGQFSFTVVNEDIEHTVDESLSFSDLAIPTIDSVSYASSEVYVEWELPDTNEPESYLVRLVDENWESVFVGQLMQNSVYAYKINSASGTWIKTPESGKTYMVEVHAFKYESGITGNEYLYNVNDLSIASAPVVWGN